MGETFGEAFLLISKNWVFSSVVGRDNKSRFYSQDEGPVGFLALKDSEITYTEKL